MINSIKKTACTLLLMIVSVAGFAQNATTGTIDMADCLYQSGKIYVVVTVLSVIMVGIVVYLIMLDRKISKLEKEINNK